MVIDNSWMWPMTTSVCAWECTLFTYCIRFIILIMVDENAKNSIKKCSV